MTEDEMTRWHHWLDGRESEWTPGVGFGQGGLACCNSWGRKESDMTERLIWSVLKGTERLSPKGQFKFKLFSSVQLLSYVRLFVTPWTAALQASLSITTSLGVCGSLPKLMSIESVMPFNRLILCCPFVLLLSIFLSRVFSNESVHRIR